MLHSIYNFCFVQTSLVIEKVMVKENGKRIIRVFMCHVALGRQGVKLNEIA